jgi:hypothetical protein
MRSRSVLVWLLVGTTSCSWMAIPTMSPPGRDETIDEPLDCPTAIAPLMDTTGALAGLGVTALGLASLAEDSYYAGITLVAIAPFFIGGLLYGASAQHGWTERAKCRDWSERSALSQSKAREACARKRTELFTMLETADPQRRAALARELPVCGRASSAVEKAWKATRQGIVAAIAEDCFTVHELAMRVREQSPAHYETVFAVQSDIDLCLTQPIDREDCLAERARRQRDAVALTDLDARARALRQLPSCN